MAVVMQGAEAASTLAEASEEMCFCRLRGPMRPAATCRMHGKAWECTQCEASLRSIRRNLGEQPQEMETFSKEETHQFFRELARLQGQDKRIHWTTVRSALVTSMTTKAVTVFKRAGRQVFAGLCLGEAGLQQRGRGALPLRVERRFAGEHLHGACEDSLVDKCP